MKRGKIKYVQNTMHRLSFTADFTKVTEDTK